MIALLLACILCAVFPPALFVVVPVVGLVVVAYFVKGVGKAAIGAAATIKQLEKKEDDRDE